METVFKSISSCVNRTSVVVNVHNETLCFSLIGVSLADTFKSVKLRELSDEIGSCLDDLTLFLILHSVNLL